MDTHKSTIQWLLEDDNPSVKYRTLKEVLGQDDHSPEVRQAETALRESDPVKGLLGKMQPEGTWLQKNPRSGRVVGDGVEYGSFGTTHFCLAYLAELGLDRRHPLVEKAAGRYLSLQQPDGDWFGHFSCLDGYNINTFVRLGFQEDERVTRALELLLKTDRFDGGYLCDFHERKTGSRQPKSCFRGSVKALLAFSNFPSTWSHPRCIRLLEYFLRRGGIFQSAHADIPVNKDVLTLSFPITWRANTFEVLYALSKMGHGGDERLLPAWEALENKADASGRFVLDWTPTQSPWLVGRRGETNKWITFYVAAAKRYRDGAGIH